MLKAGVAVNLLRHCWRIFQVNPEISDSALQPGMTEQKLDRADVIRAAVDGEVAEQQRSRGFDNAYSRTNDAFCLPSEMDTA